MNNFTSQAIILSRTDFGEADKIITLLTPNHGKIRAIAKGVRRSKSKLAGALEIFSVSRTMILPGKNEISTIMSAKLERHYGNIVKDLDRTHLAYEFMKIIDKATQDKPESAYFEILDKSLAGLDQIEIAPNLSTVWFKLQLLKLSGHQPNLKTDTLGKKLEANKKYSFDYDRMTFKADNRGKADPNLVKYLRLGLASSTPRALNRIKNTEGIQAAALSFTDNLSSIYFSS